MKKKIMVHYQPVPTDENIRDSQVQCWCLRLSRSRIIAFIVIFILSAIIVLAALSHPATFALQNFIRPISCRVNSSFQPSDKRQFHDEYEPKYKSPFYQQRLPTVIIIGARKAGTKALIQFISLHKNVVTAKKEIHYFDRNYRRNLEWYRRKMPYSFPNQITIEKTPNYFVDGDVPSRIYDYSSSIHLVLIVRNPVDRAMSDYIQLKEKKHLRTERLHSFEELVIDRDSRKINKSYSPIKRSLYCRHLDKWLKYFPLRQILIIDGENLRAHPWEELAKFERFIGLTQTINKSQFIFNDSKGFYCIKTECYNSTVNLMENESFHIDPITKVPYIEKCLSKSKGREHPSIDPGVRRKLVAYFEPYNKRFFKKINRYFDWS